MCAAIHGRSTRSTRRQRVGADGRQPPRQAGQRLHLAARRRRARSPRAGRRAGGRRRRWPPTGSFRTGTTGSRRRNGGAVPKQSWAGTSRQTTGPKPQWYNKLRRSNVRNRRGNSVPRRHAHRQPGGHLPAGRPGAARSRPHRRRGHPPHGQAAAPLRHPAPDDEPARAQRAREGARPRRQAPRRRTHRAGHRRRHAGGVGPRLPARPGRHRRRHPRGGHSRPERRAGRARVVRASRPTASCSRASRRRSPPPGGPGSRRSRTNAARSCSSKPLTASGRRSSRRLDVAGRQGGLHSAAS